MIKYLFGNEIMKDKNLFFCGGSYWSDISETLTWICSICNVFLLEGFDWFVCVSVFRKSRCTENPTDIIVRWRHSQLRTTVQLWRVPFVPRKMTFHPGHHRPSHHLNEQQSHCWNDVVFDVAYCKLFVNIRMNVSVCNSVWCL